MTSDGGDDDVPDGLRLRHFLDGHTDRITDVSWSPNGQFLASASHDRTIRLWDPDTGKEVRKLEGHGEWVSRITWQPGGQRLATGGGGRNIHVWRGKRPELTLEAFGGREFEPQAVFGVDWSPDGLLLAAGGSRGLVEIWDCERGELLKNLEGHSRDVNTVAWSPDGQVLASGSDDGTIRLWDIPKGQTRSVLRGHSTFVHSLVWEHDGQYLVSGSWDNTIRVWDPSTGLQRRVLEGHRQAVHYIALSADGRLLASKSNDSTVRFWRTDTWQNIAILPEPKDLGFVAVAFHPQLPVLATLGPQDQGIRVWDVDVEVLIARPPVGGKASGLVPRHVVQVVSSGAESKSKSFRAWAGGPRATLSIVYTDVVGSTQLGRELGNEGMDAVRNAHFGRARRLIDGRGGYELKTMGDAFLVVFRTAIEALDFALDLRADTGHPRIEIRVGIHVGLVSIEKDDAFGNAVNFASRVEGCAKGAELWLSGAAYQQIVEQKSKAHEGLRWKKRTKSGLKGFPGRHTLWSLED